MKKLIYLIIPLTIMLASCKNDPSRPASAVKAEPKNEELSLMLEETSVYAADTKGKEAVKGELTYREAKLMGENDLKKEQWYYNKSGQITTKEKFVYRSHPTQADSSLFYTLTDSLLSYYTFRYDKKGNQIARFSFDGWTNELLRQETFQYDEKGNRIGRNILNADDELVRAYTFKFDDKGNEKSYQVFNNSGKVLSGEEFRITKKDEDGEWTEMWGFKNEQPSTIKTRVKKQFKQTLKEVK